LQQLFEKHKKTKLKEKEIELLEIEKPRWDESNSNK